MSSNQIPGVPEGWELVRIGVPNDGDWRISMEGEAEVSHANCITVWPIIRKIEKPAKYRPFASAEEFKPHRDRWVRVIGDCDDCEFDPDDIGDVCKVQLYNDTAIIFYHNCVCYYSGLQCLVFDDDGTPFGVRIDGE
jgi:hypothetical protein